MEHRANLPATCRAQFITDHIAQAACLTGHLCRTFHPGCLPTKLAIQGVSLEAICDCMHAHASELGGADVVGDGGQDLLPGW